MEHTSHFTTLLKDTVNLPQGKLDSLGDRTDKIYGALRSGVATTRVLSKKRQGSWAQRTIINPPKDVEFDADVMVELDEVPGWSPSDYNDAVYDALEDDPVYGDMDEPVLAKNRCVRITYANDMHVDVIPYVNLTNGGEHIVNTTTDDWETNNADGFTDWMKIKDDLTDKNMRQVIRLLKYLRDHQGWFPNTVSIILTTIVGNTIKKENLLANADCYNNVPATLGRVVADLATWAQNNETVPTVEANTGVTFHHRWKPSEYDQFRTHIQTLNSKIAAALEEDDHDDSIELWQDLFGTGFKAPASASKTSKFPNIGAGGGAAAGAGSGASETSVSRAGKTG